MHITYMFHLCFLWFFNMLFFLNGDYSVDKVECNLNVCSFVLVTVFMSIQTFGFRKGPVKTDLP